MPGGVIFVTIFMFLLVAVIVNLIGLPILGGVSAGYYTAGDSFGLSFVPTYNELVAAAYPGNVLVALLLGFTFVFWTYVWLPINFLASTRALLAWSLDGLLPARVSEVNEERHTPTVAIIIVAILGWLSLFMYTVGIGGFKINTLYGIFGWILSFILCAISAIVFPYRLRAVFDSSPVNWRIGGIPLMSIIGVIATVALLYVEWIWWADPINGLAGTPAVFEGLGIYPQIMFLLTGGVLVTGALWYIGAWFVQRSRGVRIERAFAEIPPE
jgi:amino acid transporter